MMGLLFILLGIAALKVGLWQMGIFSSFVASPQNSDVTLGYLSLGAAVIFFGLSLVGLVNREKAKANVLFE